MQGCICQGKACRKRFFFSGEEKSGDFVTCHERVFDKSENLKLIVTGSLKKICSFF